jgi:hypothetical protein
VGEPLEQAPISDAEVLLLDVGDPYRDILWNQEHLRTVERSLSARRLELVQSIRRRVVSEAGKREWESWMDAIFARHCSLSTELELIDRVLPLIRRAEGDELTVWFFGD